MSLAIWFALGGDVSLVVGVVTAIASYLLAKLAKIANS